MTVRCTDRFVKPHRQVSQRLITLFRYGDGSHDDRAGGGCGCGSAGGRRYRGPAPGAGAGVAGGPCGALADRGDQQAMERVVGLRDARLRDSLRRGVDGEGRGALAEGLGGDRQILVKPWAQCAACGTCASASRLGSGSQLAGRPSRPASTRSHTSTDTAITCCRLAATTGSAIRAQTSAIRASMCRSPPVSPITDGISPASRPRAASEV